MSTHITLITPEHVSAWGSCYTPEEERRALTPPLSPLDLTDLRRIPWVSAADRLWVLLRPEIIPPDALRTLACDFAEHALRRERRAGREPDPRSWAAIEVARRYAAGEATNEELDAAGVAALAAARAAAGVADAAARAAAGVADAAARAAAGVADAAARAAAWDADAAARAAAWVARAAARAAAGVAWDAARAAAWDAAWAAAWDALAAARAAARDAESRWQLRRVREYLTDQKEAGNGEA